jgi:hypothetical protein
MAGLLRQSRNRTRRNQKSPRKGVQQMLTEEEYYQAMREYEQWRDEQPSVARATDEETE